MKILNKTQTNFGSLTINNLKPDLLLINKKQTNKCKVYNCILCPYLSLDHFIKINNFYLPLDENVNCNTENLVYCISCKLCKNGVFYIGETGRKASTRFKEHLGDIKNFKPYIQYNPVVAYHFNLKGHCKERDLRFHIIQDNLTNMKPRQVFENSVIHLFLKLGAQVLNDPTHIRSQYYYCDKI